MTKPKDEIENAIRKVLANRTDEAVEIALATRKAVLKSAKVCSEFLGEVYCVVNLFSFTGKPSQVFIHIATYAHHVNLGFNYGAQLDDPENLLQGTGKQIRHIRINSTSQLRSAGVKNLIASAVAHGRELTHSKGGIQPARTGIRLKDKSAAKKMGSPKKKVTSKKKVTLKSKSNKKNKNAKTSQSKKTKKR